MYIVYSSKPNEYMATPLGNINPIETYDYFFYGKLKQSITIGEVKDDEAKIKIQEIEDKDCINVVPIKFFESFGDVDEARSEIKTLISFGALDTKLKLKK